MNFRTLNANEIDCRVSTVSAKGCSLLLYKDARCDMNILDEEIGPEYWQRKHEVVNGNLFCSVGIYIPELDQWVWKQDVGVESYTEKEKGEASDSFKRACFNWGIGRELYTAPFIWITAGNVNLEEGRDGKKTTRDRFKVTDISYTDGKISALEIINTSLKNKVVYAFGKTSGQLEDEQIREDIGSKKINEVKVGALKQVADKANVTAEQILKTFNLESIYDMTESQFIECNRMLQKQIDMLRKMEKENAGQNT